MSGTININDVIQIIPRDTQTGFMRDRFDGKVAVVYDVKSWGVCASVLAPDGEYPVRLAHHEYTRVGSLDYQIFPEETDI